MTGAEELCYDASGRAPVGTVCGNMATCQRSDLLGRGESRKTRACAVPSAVLIEETHDW